MDYRSLEDYESKIDLTEISVGGVCCNHRYSGSKTIISDWDCSFLFELPWMATNKQIEAAIIGYTR